VRVVLELTAPGVQHRQAAQFSAQVLGVAVNVEQRLGHGPKEQAIEHPRIVENQRAEVLG
jgi:hypothetical protein